MSGREPLLRSAYSLLLNTVLTSGLGLGFWIVAARLFDSGEVGRDSALVAAMVQLSSVAQLNLANALVRFMPGRPDAQRLLVMAYAVSGATALLLGTAFVLTAPLLSSELAFLTDEPLTGAVYVVAVTLWGVFALQDAALTATRQAHWVPLENGVFGVLKLVLLPAVLALGLTHGIFIAWVVPMCLLLLPVNWLLFRRVLPRARRAASAPPVPFASRGGLARFLALDYLATVFAQSSLTLLPLVVIGTLGSTANAHFYIPFTIAMAFDVLFFSMSTSLVAEGARDQARIAELFRLLVRRLAVLVIPVVALLVIAAPLVMALFGAEYVESSTAVLRILVAGTIFRAAIALASAVSRLEGAGGRIAALDGCVLVALLGAAIPLAAGIGVVGVALAWFGASGVVALGIAPLLVRYWRAGGSAAGATRPPSRPA